jgi:hypothetical protein
MEITIAFTPLSRPASLADAVVRVAGGVYPGLKVLVDSLHLARCDSTPADLARVDPQLIGFSRLCDGPKKSRGMRACFEEALHERQIPGEGSCRCEGWWRPCRRERSSPRRCNAQAPRPGHECYEGSCRVIKQTLPGYMNTG